MSVCASLVLQVLPPPRIFEKRQRRPKENPVARTGQRLVVSQLEEWSYLLALAPSANLVADSPETLEFILHERDGIVKREDHQTLFAICPANYDWHLLTFG